MSRGYGEPDAKSFTLLGRSLNRVIPFGERHHRRAVAELAHPELVRTLVLGKPPLLPLLSHPSAGEAMRQSWIRRVIDPSRQAFATGTLG